MTTLELKVHVVEVVHVSCTMPGETERRSDSGDGYDFRERRDVSETDERQSDRKPELPNLEAEEGLASASGKSLRPSREQQSEDRDERQDGGHARGIGRTDGLPHP